MEKILKFLKSTGMVIAKCAIVELAITMIMIFLLSWIAYKTRMDDTKIMVGIGITYFLSNFAGGLIIGSVKEERKFLWGIVMGSVYFACLLVGSIFMGGAQEGGMPLVAAISCPIAGGCIGGMFAR